MTVLIKARIISLMQLEMHKIAGLCYVVLHVTALLNSSKSLTLHKERIVGTEGEKISSSTVARHAIIFLYPNA